MALLASISKKQLGPLSPMALATNANSIALFFANFFYKFMRNTQDINTQTHGDRSNTKMHYRKAVGAGESNKNDKRKNKIAQVLQSS